jgi:hypothetical protein
MDQTILVNRRLEDVPRLVSQLQAADFDVKAALWLYTSESGQWFLYIISDVVDKDGGRAAYRLAYGVMRQMTDLRINPFEVKLIGLTDPLAQAVIDFLAKQRAPLPTWIDGMRLGDIYIEGAYIYSGAGTAA